MNTDARHESDRFVEMQANRENPSRLSRDRKGAVFEVFHYVRLLRRAPIWLAVGGWSPIHNASWQNGEKCSSIPMCSTKCARRSGPGSSTGGHPGALRASRLESAGCARKVQPRACRCGGRASTRENHERVQSVRQPRAEAPGKRRTRSKTVGAAWKHALAMEGRGCKPRSTVLESTEFQP